MKKRIKVKVANKSAYSEIETYVDDKLIYVTTIIADGVSSDTTPDRWIDTVVAKSGVTRKIFIKEILKKLLEVLDTMRETNIVKTFSLEIEKEFEVEGKSKEASDVRDNIFRIMKEVILR